MKAGNSIIKRIVYVAEKKVYSLLLFFLLIGAFVAFQVGDLPIGPHGGKVKQVDQHYIEMKSVYPSFYAFLLDKNYKSQSNDGVSCEARFIFADSSSVDIVLKPFSNEGFVTSAAPQTYAFCRLFFNMNGKTISAGFESGDMVVRKK